MEMEDNLKGRWPQMKTASQEEDLTGRQISRTVMN